MFHDRYEVIQTFCSVVFVFRFRFYPGSEPHSSKRFHFRCAKTFEVDYREVRCIMGVVTMWGNAQFALVHNLTYVHNPMAHDECTLRIRPN